MRPEYKCARDIEAGDWLDFGGGLAYLAGRPIKDDEWVWVPLGYGGAEFRPHERVRMFYDA